MLPSTPEEKQDIIDYMNSQAPDLTVKFLQKLYIENVHGDQHAIWDVDTNKDRWWVITNPTNLYSQEQFPSIDLAVTFHVGLCLRIPRGERSKPSDHSIEPLAACFRRASEASEALASAQRESGGHDRRAPLRPGGLARHPASPGRAGDLPGLRVETPVAGARLSLERPGYRVGTADM